MHCTSSIKTGIFNQSISYRLTASIGTETDVEKMPIKILVIFPLFSSDELSKEACFAKLDILATYTLYITLICMIPDYVCTK